MNQDPDAYEFLGSTLKYNKQFFDVTIEKNINNIKFAPHNFRND